VCRGWVDFPWPGARSLLERLVDGVGSWVLVPGGLGPVAVGEVVAPVAGVKTLDPGLAVCAGGRVAGGRTRGWRLAD
jgi:hypothetical protein